MSINPLMVLWLESLVRRGPLGPSGSVIELGPQDVQGVCRETLSAVAERLGGGAASHLQTIFPDGATVPPMGAQKALYAMFGLDEYHSVDLYNAQADYDHDLNRPFEPGRTWSVVTNFGTAEHCFNIAACFETIHRLTEPGGLMLHVLPAMGDVNHGFYNIHPLLYASLARANDYVVEDIRYVDHLLLRSMHCVDRPDLAFDFASLPIDGTTLERNGHLARNTSVGFVKNMANQETLDRILPLGVAAAAMVFDYCFVALRKQSERPFAFPTQAFHDNPR